MMGQDGFVNRELVSALADGQLRGHEFAEVLGAMADSSEAVVAWHSYHLVGDLLRSNELGACGNDMAFVARLRDALPSRAMVQLHKATEPGAVQVAPATAIAAAMPLPNQSANDSVTRWRRLAGVASVVAMAAVGWNFAGFDGAGKASNQMALLPASAPTVAATAAQAEPPGGNEPPVMLRDARLDELLAAHKQFGGTSALQMPAGFLRNATFESPGH